jgi:hypothetical protein
VSDVRAEFKWLPSDEGEVEGESVPASGTATDPPAPPGNVGPLGSPAGAKPPDGPAVNARFSRCHPEASWNRDGTADTTAVLDPSAFAYTASVGVLNESTRYDDAGGAPDAHAWRADTGRSEN